MLSIRSGRVKTREELRNEAEQREQEIKRLHKLLETQTESMLQNQKMHHIIEELERKDMQILNFQLSTVKENRMINKNFDNLIGVIEKSLEQKNEQKSVDWRVQSLRRELAVKKEKISALERENRHLEKENKSQEEIFRLKEHQFHMMMDGKNHLVGRFGTDVSDYFQEMIAKNRTLEDTVETLQDKVEDMEEDETKMQNEIKKLKEELEHEKRKNLELKEWMNLKEERLRELREEKDEKIEELRKEIQQLKESQDSKIYAHISIENIVDLAAALNGPDAPAEPMSRAQECTKLFEKITKEDPEATKFLAVQDMVDLIWDGKSKEEILRIVYNLKQHKKWAELPNWRTTEELEAMLKKLGLKDPKDIKKLKKSDLRKAGKLVCKKD
ncbi:hypothetical protein L5515_012483 [Caenorhabditis briggsae]|uniref:Uncharacterized protein n=1 Tax=Caenorhabditis briggsae TaxID=6238 RepID=A0AAE9EW23_CAEBR|nr:hypothetical protein L5515_012483 [Caenorhabditis briggsae]